MVNKKKNLGPMVIVGALFSCLSLVCSADIIDVSYKNFYSHVKKLDKEDTQALQFAFGFKHIETKQLCKLHKVYIKTDKKNIPLTYTTEQRFSIPSERALVLADAVIVVDFGEQPANKCDLSVQIETKPNYLKTEYSVDELTFIKEQYMSFFDEMGSFLSFMMPSVEGLMIHFSDEKMSHRFNNDFGINQGLLTIEEKWFSDNKVLKLPEKPLRITALTL